MIDIIVMGRSDNFGGGFADRLIGNAQFNTKVLDGAGIPYQFTFVEWNSPGDQVGDLARRFTTSVSFAQAYVIGPEIHCHVCDNPNMVVMEFFAKNVAVRRSRCPVVLCTNADVRFGRECIELFRKWSRLDPCVLYRTKHRVNFDRNAVVRDMNDLEDRKHWLQDLTTLPPLFSQAAGDFQLANSALWDTLRGYDETIRWAKIHKDRRLCHQVLLLKGRVLAYGRCFHTDHDDSYMTMKDRYAVTSHNGPEYLVKVGMPYKNPTDWGLTWCTPQGVGPAVIRLCAPKGYRLRSSVPKQLVVPVQYRKR